jgi:hypothetical protein
MNNAPERTYGDMLQWSNGLIGKRLRSAITTMQFNGNNSFY